MADEPVVRLSGMTKMYGDMTAVDDLSFAVSEGEFFSLLGPSGCGKSTTLRTIAGFETPTSGTVSIAGTDVTETPAHERDTGMVFQGYALFPHKTVGENVGFGLKIDGVAPADRERRVAEMLGTVGLSGFADRDPASLSGGQQQRVALARALIVEPSVLLLDEPLAALDRKLRQELRRELKRTQERLDITTVYVTHDQEEALSMSDRILVLEDGEARQIDTPRRLYERPDNEFVADFIGEANLLSGTVTDRDADSITLDLSTLAVESVRIPRACVSGGVPELGEHASLNVRPEAISVNAPTPEPIHVDGEVLTTTYVGKSTRFVVEARSEELLAETAADGSPAHVDTGDTVSLSWAPEHCTVVTPVA